VISLLWGSHGLIAEARDMIETSVDSQSQIVINPRHPYTSCLFHIMVCGHTKYEAKPSIWAERSVALCPLLGDAKLIERNEITRNVWFIINIYHLEIHVSSIQCNLFDRL